MNFATYLLKEVTPLSAYVPACEARQKVKGTAKAKGMFPRQCLEANKATHERSVAKYKAVMGTEWTPTKVIESRLGMSRSSCMPSLIKWKSMGLVEKRKIGDPKSWTRMKGNEWRWVK